MTAAAAYFFAAVCLLAMILAAFARRGEGCGDTARNQHGEGDA